MAGKGSHRKVDTHCGSLAAFCDTEKEKHVRTRCFILVSIMKTFSVVTLRVQS